MFGFEGISNLKIYHIGIFFSIWLVGQAVKTPPSHGGNRGSIPLRAVDCFYKTAQPIQVPETPFSARFWVFLFYTKEDGSMKIR